MSGNLRFSLSPESGGPVQTKPYTCGAASLLMCHVVARTGRGAELMREAHECSTDPVTGLETCFASAELAMIKRTNALYRPERGLRVPWPSRLGTSPWGAKAELEAITQGRTYTVSVCRWRSVSWASTHLAAIEKGFPTVLYVGSASMPRHVVMLCRDEHGDIVRYDPADGSIRHLDVASDNPWGLPAAGWPEAWLFIHPTEKTVGHTAPARRLHGGPSSVAPEGA